MVLRHKDRFHIVPNVTGYPRRTIGDGREIDSHEPKDHVVCDVREVVRYHMRGIEDLCGRGHASVSIDIGDNGRAFLP